jgi:hypothetical protein
MARVASQFGPALAIARERTHFIRSDHGQPALRCCSSFQQHAVAQRVGVDDSHARQIDDPSRNDLPAVFVAGKNVQFVARLVERARDCPQRIRLEHGSIFKIGKDRGHDTPRYGREGNDRSLAAPAIAVGGE